MGPGLASRWHDPPHAHSIHFCPTVLESSCGPGWIDLYESSNSADRDCLPYSAAAIVVARLSVTTADAIYGGVAEHSANYRRRHLVTS